MNRKAQLSFHDKQDEIQKCLNCTRPRCNDCLSRGLDISKAKPKGIKGADIELLNAFLNAYVEYNRDILIGNAVGKSQSTITKYRMSLDFPPPSAKDKEERRKLVEAYRMKEAADAVCS